ncbi:Oidioi.mRNA.OKI2018_I69.chr2.g5178.t1.cds [Oikopleura dioica]|uniref:Oidioi.mRNA.OKI2018_I69.chr2.g5167.t1.cds n=1 Tax=Oikopleura dioica TaxID=34765 RepID=A0ABN7T018_OIKDI|nr:Oidioi.mRNA.OKI2018_I69.chr2.g5167.t1.cds [Oikopleura dioica]CAG5110820.1 Oidioi.mRNA.OKI2018_I69.chr2.g5178.t1.cds [Oikopleura dioica]
MESTIKNEELLNSQIYLNATVQNYELAASILPFLLVFGGVIILFLGLCIYLTCVCPSFIRDLSLETKSNGSEDSDDESGTMTTDLNSSEAYVQGTEMKFLA